MSGESRPTVICVTPVRNEAHHLPWFLGCAATWADRIIIADQRSTDGSREIAARHPKVRLIENDSVEYDEARRQRLLLDAAREEAGRRVIIALDADEALSANWRDSPEWTSILAAAPGTVFRFPWANIRPDRKSYWLADRPVAFGLADDGSAHTGTRLHSTRIPAPASAPSLELRDVVVMHLQYVDWPRMASKQRWYQVMESLSSGHKRPVTLYRQYHHMDGVLPAQIRPIPADWVRGYEAAGWPLGEAPRAPRYYWDEEIVRWMSEHGAARFRKLAIWDIDWSRIARDMGVASPEALRDPRSSAERAVHAWLARTQWRANAWRTRAVQWALRPFGW